MLENMTKNVSSGLGVFGHNFYKIFSKILKTKVVGAITEIYENGEIPIALRLGIIALIPKG